jgi:hypothetical protein
MAGELRERKGREHEEIGRGFSDLRSYRLQEEGGRGTG